MAQIAERTGGMLVGDGSTVVNDVVHDSRSARAGAVFVAVRGLHTDGHNFVTQAEQAGAAGVVVEREASVGIPQIIVGDSRAALAPAAATVHHDPARQLGTVGVTGTNGKTTVTHMIESIAMSGGKRIGRIGTLGARLAGRNMDIPRTTPEATDLQRLLRSMVSDGIEVVAMEVSSHALALHRVDEILFDVTAFTNLSQDHLDFHGDIESYYQMKRKLFAEERAKSGVVCIDDQFGKRLAGEVEVPVTTVSVVDPADVRSTNLDVGIGASQFDLVLPDGSRRVRLPIGGAFNVANALVAAASAHHLGFSSSHIADGLGSVPAIPGRFEPVDIGQAFSVLVDYAHTPDGVRTVVSAARQLTGGSIIVVFGAGGDRDRSKRPLMGRAAAEEADLVVVTSDNPRSEDPADIVRQVAAGVSQGGKGYVEEIDRRAAIRFAIRQARPGDIVLVLGKGHERGQEIGGRMVAFDDRQVAIEELERL